MHCRRVPTDVSVCRWRTPVLTTTERNTLHQSYVFIRGIEYKQGCFKWLKKEEEEEKKKITGIYWKKQECESIVLDSNIGLNVERDSGKDQSF